MAGYTLLLRQDSTHCCRDDDEWSGAYLLIATYFSWYSSRISPLGVAKVARQKEEEIDW